jgi:hypothetical protein
MNTVPSAIHSKPLQTNFPRNTFLPREIAEERLQLIGKLILLGSKDSSSILSILPKKVFKIIFKMELEVLGLSDQDYHGKIENPYNSRKLFYAEPIEDRMRRSNYYLYFGTKKKA